MEELQSRNITYGNVRDEKETSELWKLYEAVCNYPKEAYHDLLVEKKSAVFLYHLAAMRRQLLEWFSFQGTERILELGAGAGALTELLAERGFLVDAVEPSEILAKCNAKRNASSSNLRIFAGCLECAHKEWEVLEEGSYDMVVLANSLTDASYLMGRAATQAEVLNLALRYLKQGGQLILSIENRMGLKYWAGCKDGATGTYFGGIEGEKDKTLASGRTKRELEELLCDAGLREYRFYYPYPDAQFPTMIYSDEYLPKEGELRTNLRNYDADRYLLFDERKVFDTLLRENRYPEYANAFLVIAAKGKIR